MYTAEALAIFKAIEYTILEINDNNITTHSDSLSTSLKKKKKSPKCSPPYLQCHAGIIQNARYRAKLSGNNISYSLVPGHCNINANEHVETSDKQVRSSMLVFSISSLTLPQKILSKLIQ